MKYTFPGLNYEPQTANLHTRQVVIDRMKNAGFSIYTNRITYKTALGTDEIPPHSDHARMWRHPVGEYIYTMQPYDHVLLPKYYRTLLDYSHRHRLGFFISAGLSWHFAPRTVLIAFSRAPLLKEVFDGAEMPDV